MADPKDKRTGVVAIEEDGGPIVRLRMMRRQPHGMGMPSLKDYEIYFRVELYSLMRHGLISFIDVDAQNSEDDARKAVMVAAGALAEHQCEKYKDIWNPNDIAAMAGEAYVELLADVRARAN